MRISIVEDEQAQRDLLQSYIERYSRESGIQFDVEAFADGRGLLADYHPDHDIILLDIELPGMNGMEIAELIRAQDEDVVLMFITNMAQYAVGGYAVGALDFVLKPINYNTFSMRFARAIKRAGMRKSGQILLNLPDCVRRIETQKIYYVEVMNKMLHYHTQVGEFVLRGTMQSVENELARYNFVRCNHWYLVNLRHVTFLTALTAYVGGQ